MPFRIGFTGDVMLGRLVDDRPTQSLRQCVWGTSSGAFTNWTGW